jgi:Fe-Mn family superoxide dismutase
MRTIYKKSSCENQYSEYPYWMTTSIDRRNFVKLSAAAAASAFSVSHAAEESAVYTLPALAYDPAALEPHIDALTMTIHHGKHHAAYITKLNDALTANPVLKKDSLDNLMAQISKTSDAALMATLRNNGGGHWNHNFFWKIMAPAKDCGQASAELVTAINASFGSMDAMKTAFADAAMKRFGSGWAWLIMQDGKLKITSTPNQDNPLMKGLVADADLGKPLIGLDVWEHAYYLHYQNRRADYITAWWNVLNWNVVNKSFAG